MALGYLPRNDIAEFYIKILVLRVFMGFCIQFKFQQGIRLFENLSVSYMTIIFGIGT